jgi:hypothetical protein
MLVQNTLTNASQLEGANEQYMIQIGALKGIIRDKSEQVEEFKNALKQSDLQLQELQTVYGNCVTELKAKI